MNTTVRTISKKDERHERPRPFAVLCVLVRKETALALGVVMLCGGTHVDLDCPGFPCTG